MAGPSLLNYAQRKAKGSEFPVPFTRSGYSERLQELVAIVLSWPENEVDSMCSMCCYS